MTSHYCSCKLKTLTVANFKHANEQNPLLRDNYNFQFICNSIYPFSCMKIGEKDRENGNFEWINAFRFTGKEGLCNTDHNQCTPNLEKERETNLFTDTLHVIFQYFN